MVTVTVGLASELIQAALGKTVFSSAYRVANLQEFVIAFSGAPGSANGRQGEIIQIYSLDFTC